jgi:hypothetical protein
MDAMDGKALWAWQLGIGFPSIMCKATTSKAREIMVGSWGFANARSILETKTEDQPRHVERIRRGEMSHAWAKADHHDGLSTVPK